MHCTASVREKGTECVDPHDAVPRLGRTFVEGSVAKLSTADPGDMQEDIEPSAQNIEGKLE